MSRLRMLLVGGGLGLAVLGWLGPGLHPAAKVWGLEFDRAEAARRAAAAVRRTGFDVSGWPWWLTAEASTRRELVRRQVPGNPLWSRLTPLEVRVAFRQPGGSGTVLVDLFRDGRPARISVVGLDPPASAQAPAAVAEEALRAMAGDLASTCKLVSAGEEADSGYRVVKECRTPEMRPPFARFSALVRDGWLREAELEANYGLEGERTAQRLREQGATLALVGFACVVVALLPSLWLAFTGIAQRRVGLRFALRLLLVVLAVWTLAHWAVDLDEVVVGAAAENRDPLLTRFGSLLAMAALTLVMSLVMVAGRSAAPRADASQWRTLMLLCLGNWRSRDVHRSVLAGAAWAPVLAAIPFLVAAASPMAVPNFSAPADLTARWPVVAQTAAFFAPAVVGVFGFLVPVAGRYLRGRIARSLVTGLAGVAAFGVMQGHFLDPLAPRFFDGALLLIASGWLYRRFDLLALLAATGIQAVLLQVLSLGLSPAAELRMQGGMTGGAWLAVLAVSAWFAARGSVEEIDLEDAELPASERELLEAEFRLARRAQQGWLPAAESTLAGWPIAAVCAPAREVGGDLFDYWPVDDKRWVVCVADVSGKGVPAALYMTFTKGLLAAARHEPADLAALLNRWNARFREAGHRRTFVTAALGLFDVERREMLLARSGHNAVLWWSAARERAEYLCPSGLGLGFAPPGLFARNLEVARIGLEPGDRMLFYSDGLTEAMSPQRELYGEERLLAAFERAARQPASAVRQALLDDLAGFQAGAPPHDDLTLVVIEVPGVVHSNGLGD
jgi:serine phosphatase RsbU (regulator of sigma subunit)